MDENTLSNQVIGAAIEVHRHMGAGLLESVYQQCMVHELSLRGIPATQEYAVGANYKGLEFETAYRADFVVAGKLILELKVAESLLAVHEAQLLSYLRLSGLKLGLLINFNAPVLRNGIKRIVNRL